MLRNLKIPAMKSGFLRLCFRAYSTETKAKTSLGNPPPLKVFGIEGRYVSALYSAAHQMKQLDEVEKHFKDLQKVINKPKVQDFFATSLMNNNQKAALLKSLGKESGMPPAAINFLEIVALNGRLKMLRKMITQYLAIMVAHRNESHCEVISAKPLDPESRKALMDVLQKFAPKNKKVQIAEIVDPKIIGGIIIGIEDKHIDLSIARKIVFYTNLLQQDVV